MGGEFASCARAEHAEAPAERIPRRADPVRRALAVGRSDDVSERDADRVADAVVSGVSDRSLFDPNVSTRIRRADAGAQADRTIRRAVISMAVSGLDRDVDSTSRTDFARAVGQVWDPRVLEEMQRLIGAEQATPGLDAFVERADREALWCIRDRFAVLARPEEDRIKMDDPRYQKYGVANSLDTAERIIDVAIAKLGSVTESTPVSNPVMQTFRSFFTTATPAQVRSRLQFARAQVARYRPQAPPGVVDQGGGHACIDSSMPEMQYMNQGSGANARLIIGVKSWNMTPGARAYNVVHEATHGAPQLGTVDHAYRWQRLFPYLSPELQLANADSYGMLVGVLAGLSEASTGMTDAQKARKDLPAAGEDVETNGLAPAVDDAVKRGWAWLEYYATQVFLNLRDLTLAVNRGDQLIAGSYQDTLYRTITSIAPLAPDPPAAMTAMMGHFQRLVQHTAFAKPVFCAAAPPAPLGGDRFAVVVPPSLDLAPKHTTLWHLVMWHRRLGLSPGDAGRYERLLPAIVRASGWIGPLST